MAEGEIWRTKVKAEKEGDDESMRPRRNYRRRALVQRIILVALLMAVASVVIAHIAIETVGREASAISMSNPQETNSFELEKTHIVLQESTSVVNRYSAVVMTEEERNELAGIIYLEARGEPIEGQQVVAEVVLNRVISPDFPDSVSEVLHQGEGTDVPQFSTIDLLSVARPGPVQYDAIEAALYGISVLPADVVFFSQNGENDRVWGKIGGHVFCYGYKWE